MATTPRSESKDDCRFCHGTLSIIVSRDPDEEVDCVCTDRPARVQLSRRKGWRKPENTVVVARPTQWGNPFTVVDGDHAGAVALFRKSVIGFGIFSRENIRAELAGKNLACWCSMGDACHADVLLEIANGRDHV